eukprot:PhM_4_TR15542/c0_g1_i1/m.49942
MYRSTIDITVGETVRGSLHLPLLPTEVEACDAPLSKLPKEVRADSFLPLPHPPAFAPFVPAGPGNLGADPAYFGCGDVSIIAHAAEIVESLKSSLVTCIVGKKGCGKSTFMPHLMLGTTPGVRVYVVSPYEATASLLAHRLCQTRDLQLGADVGIHTPSTALLQPSTPVVVCTPQMIVRRMHNGCDPTLLRSTLVLDDVQEREPYTDLLLLLGKQLVQRNHRVVLMLTSATPQQCTLANRLQSYFEGGQQGFFSRINVHDPADDENEFGELPEPRYEPLDLLRAVARIHGAEGDEHAMAADIGRLSDKDVDATVLAERGIVPLVAEINATAAIEHPGAVFVVLPDETACAAVACGVEGVYVPSSARGLRTITMTDKSTFDDISEAVQTIATLESAKSTRPVVLTTHAFFNTATTVVPRVLAVLDSARTRVHRYRAHEDLHVHETVWISQDRYMCGVNVASCGANGATEQEAEDSPMPLHVAFVLAQQIPELLPREAQQVPMQYTPHLPDIVLHLHLLTELLVQSNVERIMWLLPTVPQASSIDAVSLQLEQQSLINTAKHTISSFGRAIAHLGVGVLQGRLLLYGLCFGVLRPMCVSAAFLTCGAPGSNIDGVVAGGCESLAFATLFNQYLSEDDKAAFCANVGGLSTKVMTRIHATVLQYERTLAECALLRGPPSGASMHADSLELVRHAAVSAMYPRVVQSSYASGVATFPSLMPNASAAVVWCNVFRGTPFPFPDGTLVAFGRREQLPDGSVAISGMLNVAPPLSVLLSAATSAVEETRHGAAAAAAASNASAGVLCRGWWDDVEVTGEESEDADVAAAHAITVKVPAGATYDPHQPGSAATLQTVRLDRCLVLHVEKRLTKTLLQLRSALHAYVLNLLAVSRAHLAPISLPTVFGEVLVAMLSSYMNPSADAKYLHSVGNVDAASVSLPGPLMDLTSRAVSVYRTKASDAPLTPVPDVDVNTATAPSGFVDVDADVAQHEEEDAAKVQHRPKPAGTTFDGVVPGDKERLLIERTVELFLSRASKAFELDFRRQVSTNPAFRFLVDFHSTYPFYMHTMKRARRAREEQIAQEAALNPSSAAHLALFGIGRKSNKKKADAAPPVVDGPLVQVAHCPPHVAVVFALSRRRVLLEASVLNTIVRCMVPMRSRVFPSLFHNRRLVLPRAYAPAPAPEGAYEEVYKMLLQCTNIAAQQSVPPQEPPAHSMVQQQQQYPEVVAQPVMMPPQQQQQRVEEEAPAVVPPAPPPHHHHHQAPTMAEVAAALTAAMNSVPNRTDDSATATAAKPSSSKRDRDVSRERPKKEKKADKKEKKDKHDKKREKGKEIEARPKPQYKS